MLVLIHVYHGATTWPRTRQGCVHNVKAGRKLFPGICITQIVRSILMGSNLSGFVDRW